MSALEDEIVERFEKLEPEAKLRLLKRLEHDIEPAFDYDAWFAKAEAFRKQLTATYGDGYSVGVQDLVDEIREEASWPRW